MNFNLANYKVKPLIGLIILISTTTSGLVSYIQDYGIVVSVSSTAVVMIFLVWYDKELWKKKFWNYFCTVPDLNGEYDGAIFFHRDNENRQHVCKLRIVQTCSNISVFSSFPKEDENDTWSDSMDAMFRTNGVGEQTLVFTYHNAGSGMDGDTLEPHDGVNLLRISKGDEGYTLEGEYFTNRSPQTKGKMTVKQKPKKEQNEHA